MIETVKKAVGASIMIALGNYALMKLGNPIGPVIFAFGLLGVCFLGLNLFTGKCGFLFEKRLDPTELTVILLVNLAAGYLVGLLMSVADAGLIEPAAAKAAGWDFSFSFLIKAFFCGVIMYAAVKMYQKNTSLGIIFGIPLFIFCGFQHCIANVITLGMGRTFSWTLLLAVIGNFAGSLLLSWVSREKDK